MCLYVQANIVYPVPLVHVDCDVEQRVGHVPRKGFATTACNGALACVVCVHAVTTRDRPLSVMLGVFHILCTSGGTVQSVRRLSAECSKMVGKHCALTTSVPPVNNSITKHILLLPNS